MKNRLSGSSVNNSKIKIYITAYRRRHAAVAVECFAPLPRVLARHHRRGIFVVCCRSQTSSSRLKIAVPLSSLSSFPASARRRRPHCARELSHRRAVSVVPSYAKVIASVLRFSTTCSRRLSWLESPGATASSPSPAEAPPPSPRRGQAIPDRLRLHQAHRRDRGELLNVMCTSLLTLPHSCRGYAVSRRARAAMAGVGSSPVYHLPFQGWGWGWVRSKV